MAKVDKKLISIITPCFNEEGNVHACVSRTREIFRTALKDYKYEHIFTDNASTDNTVPILREIASADEQIKVIVNSRNVGPFRNIFGALAFARGNAVVPLMAADLQDPPEVIVDFIRAWEDGYKIVYGIRAKRREKLIMVLIRKLYYRLLRLAASSDIPNDASEFQLLDRSIVDQIMKVDDYYPYVRGLVAQTGASRKGVKYTWESRYQGKSKNSLYDLFDQGLNGFVATGNGFIRLIILLGGSTALLSILYAVIQLTMNLLDLGKVPAAGIPTIIIAIFFFAGVQLFFLGVIGEYVGSIHQQVRRGLSAEITEKINIPS